MKSIHIIFSLLCLIGASVGVFTLDEATPMLGCALLLAAAMLQMPAIILSARKSLVFRLKIPHISLIFLLLDAALCGMVLLGVDGAINIFPIALVASAIVLIPIPRTADPDPTGERFTSLLTEALDTISRATAERDCGIHTQLLYEKARFCEPCADPSVRPTEKRILAEILSLHPKDSDDIMAKKCAVISAMLDERARMTRSEVFAKH